MNIRMTETLKHLIQDCSIISFDIFDTILLRPYLNPVDLFHHVEKDNALNGFANDRICAIKNAYQTVLSDGKCEVTIDDIYRAIPQWKGYKEKELEAERQALSINPEILEIWKFAQEKKKKCIITSDMYLPSGFLKQILTEKGITGWDNFYVSCEKQQRKSDGGLFRLILDNYKCQAKEILHIGDNKVSDYEIPTRLGIRAFYYPDIHTLFLQDQVINVFYRDHKTFEGSLFLGSLSLSWHTITYKNKNESSFVQKLGAWFAAPLGYSYCKWIKEQTELHGFERILFVARDGYLLQKIYQDIDSKTKTDYVYAPRPIATMLLQEFGSDLITIKSRRKYVLNYLTSNYGAVFSEEETSAFIEEEIFPSEKKQMLDVAIRELRDRYQEYISSLNIKEEKCALVEGKSASFSAQKLLSVFLHNQLSGLYLNTNTLLNDTSSYIYTPNKGFNFGLFPEILFSAPFPPAIDVDGKSPIYQSTLDFYEKQKVDEYSQLEDAALMTTQMFNRFGVAIDQAMVMDWIDCYAQKMPLEDEHEFEIMKTAYDVSHSQYISPRPSLPKVKYDYIYKCGIHILSVVSKRINCKIVSEYSLPRLNIVLFRKEESI